MVSVSVLVGDHQLEISVRDAVNERAVHIVIDRPVISKPSW